MNVATGHIRSEDYTKLPPEVHSLFPREQEIARIVYDKRLATAKDVEAQLSVPVANASIRAMLNRLVHKGILLRHERGRGKTIVYAAALTDSFVRRAVLTQFANDFYAGSLIALADELNDFFVRPPRISELVGEYKRFPPGELEDLSPRMRQIADIVYRRGCASTKEVRAELGMSVTEYCVRTMINRLAERKIVTKRQRTGHKETVYLPALVSGPVRRIALKRLIDKRFGGSEMESLEGVLQLLRPR